MEALEVVMKKQNINIDSSSTTSFSYGHALSIVGFSFNATSTSSSNEWLIDYGAYHHMNKDKTIFLLLMNVTPQIFFSDDRSLNVVGYGTIQIDNDHFNDVSCVSSICYNLLSLYQITHLGECKTIEF